MNKDYKFLTTADLIQKRHSGWSGAKCKTCRREMTKAQYSYSMRVYKRPLCRTCQSLENYSKGT
jgi:hypothetical protein